MAFFMPVSEWAKNRGTAAAPLFYQCAASITACR